MNHQPLGHTSANRSAGGLARITAQPAEREYHVAQFLGDAPAVVPPVLTGELRTPIRPSQGEALPAVPKHPSPKHLGPA